MKIFVLLSLLIFITGCANSQIEVDEGGSADYYLQNNSDYPLVIQYLEVYQLGGSIITTQTISNGSNFNFLNDFIIGVNPKPSDSMESISLLTSTNNDTNLIKVYIQDPINNNIWSLQKNYSGYFGLSIYTLIISNNNLNLNGTN